MLCNGLGQGQGNGVKVYALRQFCWFCRVQCVLYLHKGKFGSLSVLVVPPAAVPAHRCKNNKQHCGQRQQVLAYECHKGGNKGQVHAD